MPSAEAHISVEDPQRYLVQLCKHATAMDRVGPHRPHTHSDVDNAGRAGVQVCAEYSDGAGLLTFTPWGRCRLQATVGVLTIRAEADDEQDLRRIQRVITADLERFGRRSRLSVAWHPPEPHR
jgi:hypothetical protein